MHSLLRTFGKICNYTNKGMEHHRSIILCALFLVMGSVGSVIIFQNYRIRQAHRRSENLQVELVDGHLKEIEKELQQLRPSYESLVRKHRTTAISLNKQIEEVQKEVELWKAIETNKYLINSKTVPHKCMQNTPKLRITW
uniref:Uncharacterized protein n=1 Tax=Glossina palpalis gambiensis TaxID=67801 RepID=A0A1B0BA63_9MUSC